jgi:hypothetical protein
LLYVWQLKPGMVINTAPQILLTYRSDCGSKEFRVDRVTLVVI